jgi:outer membrane protein OmpA-like peptidoglycan-associated protein
MKVLAVVAWLAAAAQPQPVQFSQPSSQPESVSDAADFPYLPALFGARLIQTSKISGPLEVRSANADDEAVLAGLSYIKKTYDSGNITPALFVTMYREHLYAAGWKLIASTKVDAVTMPEGVVSVSAHYMANGRDIYTLVALPPDGPYEISVADVGAEDWSSWLARECRLRVPSLYFDLDRPTLRVFESTPSLEKLADVLKSKNVPAVEIEGHADNIGEAGVAARQLLSEQRAKAVAAWLTSHGVPASKIASKGYGKLRPIAENDSDLGRALNRRIEIAKVGCSPAPGSPNEGAASTTAVR